jgi:hypothetical protein
MPNDQTDETTTMETPEYAEDVVVLDNRGQEIPDDDNVATQPRHGHAGRPRLEINLDRLKAVASTFATYDEIAVFFGCHPETLRRRFSHIINEGRALGKMSVRQEMRTRMKRSDRVLIHMYERHVEPPVPKGENVVVIAGDGSRPLIVREVDEDTDSAIARR